jgi:hypothetical protein
VNPYFENVGQMVLITEAKSIYAQLYTQLIKETTWNSPKA